MEKGEEAFSIFDEKNLNREEKQIRLNYDKIVTRFKNISYVALVLTMIGIILLFTFVYEYKKIGSGISIFLISIILSIVMELINMNISILKLKENIKEYKIDEAFPFAFRCVYKISYMVFISITIMGISLIPFTNSNGCTLSEYYLLIPFLATLSIIMVYVLKIIAHTYFKKKNMHQLFENPFNSLSKNIIFIAIILMIYSLQQSDIILNMIPQILTIPFILIILFYVIIYLSEPYDFS